MADNLTMVPARPEVTQVIPCQANAIVGNKDIWNESVAIQLAECWFPGLAISNAKIWIYFSNKKFTEAILSDSNQKLLWFEISKMLIAVLKDKFIVLSIIIFGTLVPVKSIAGGKDISFGQPAWRVSGNQERMKSVDDISVVGESFFHLCLVLWHC